MMQMMQNATDDADENNRVICIALMKAFSCATNGAI